ncbi:hypothetical protein Tco_0991138 [Tanacetum coccineum]|uniref:Uncharacterized protein n=1 Tax=Tanacetum coccineum TaxID=301880 RepID=A0ABQ5EYT1_9ASTR
MDAPAAEHQASGSGSGAGAEVSAPSAEGNVVEENVILEGAFLDLIDPEGDVTVVEKDIARKQPEKAKRKKLLKRSDPFPAKRLRVDHPSLVFGTGCRAEGVLLSEKDAEIARLKSLVREKETESTEVLHLHDHLRHKPEIELRRQLILNAVKALEEAKSLCRSSSAVPRAKLSHPIYIMPIEACLLGSPLVSLRFLMFHTTIKPKERKKACHQALRHYGRYSSSHPLSSQNLLGEASTSLVAPCVEDLDTDEDLGSVVCMPQFEDPRFKILP